MNPTQETNTQSNATAPVEVKPGVTDSTVVEKKIKLNRAQLRRMVAQAKRKAFGRPEVSEKERQAKRKKRKVQRASRKRNRQ